MVRAASGRGKSQTRESSGWTGGRGDLDLGCLELLIGLVLIADPPENESDWRARYERPLGARLRERLDGLSPHFELDGTGPRFMQDLEPFETERRAKASPADMLFIDSPGDEDEGATTRTSPCPATDTEICRLDWQRWRSTRCRRGPRAEARVTVPHCGEAGGHW